MGPKKMRQDVGSRVSFLGVAACLFTFGVGFQCLVGPSRSSTTFHQPVCCCRVSMVQPVLQVISQGLPVLDNHNPFHHFRACQLLWLKPFLDQLHQFMTSRTLVAGKVGISSSAPSGPVLPQSPQSGPGSLPSFVLFPYVGR